jgi:two-component system chemotaxis response regulator CheB
MPKNPAPIRVVIVEDSRTMTDLLVAILSAAGDIHVVGTAADGEAGVRLVQRLRPDLVTMDMYMPKMNGVEAVKAIMRTNPVPIVIVSADNKPHTMDLTFHALRAGALTVVNKPGLQDPKTSQKLVQTVRLMAGVPVIHHWGTVSNTPSAVSHKPASSALIKNQYRKIDAKIRVVGIAASTGGPSTIAAVLKNLPADFPLPVALVQHFSPGFAGGLADWLGTQTSLRVDLAIHGDPLQPGTLVMAPDDYHLRVNRAGEIELSKEPAYKGLRPSANPLFESLAVAYGSAAMGIILTGMGDDGAEGLLKLHQAGGITIAQEEESCVVYGMPREAVARGAVDQLLTPEQIGFALEQISHRRSIGGGGSDGL